MDLDVSSTAGRLLLSPISNMTSHVIRNHQTSMIVYGLKNQGLIPRGAQVPGCLQSVRIGNSNLSKWVSWHSGSSAHSLANSPRPALGHPQGQTWNKLLLHVNVPITALNETCEAPMHKSKLLQSTYLGLAVLLG